MASSAKRRERRWANLREHRLELTLPEMLRFRTRKRTHADKHLGDRAETDNAFQVRNILSATKHTRTKVIP